MSILNVNQIQPVGGGNTITVSASDISASGATITATSFVGSVTGTTSNASGATGDFSIADKIVHTGDTNTAIRFPAADTFTVETAGSEKLRIDSSGHLLHGVIADEDTSGNGGLRFINTGDIQIDGDQRALVFRSTVGTAQLQSAIEWWNENGAGVQSKIACDRTAVTQAPSDLVFYTNANVDTSANNSEGDITERLRITSAGLVGIATAVPSYRLDIGDGATDPANGYQLRVNAAGDYIFALQKQSNASFSIRNNSTGIVHLNTQNSKILSLGVSSGNASGSIEDDVRIDSNGHLTVRDGNLVIGTSGHGIDFSATANSSGTMSSELLDDYEEGTFTPVWGDGSSAYSSPAPTYSTQAGYYTKIGNVVHYDIHLVTTAWNSAGTVMWIYGLPFTTRSSLYQQGGGGTFCIEGVDSQDAINNLTTQIGPNRTSIELYYQTPATGANYNTFGTGNVSEANQVNIRVSGFYYTNS